MYCFNYSQSKSQSLFCNSKFELHIQYNLHENTLSKILTIQVEAQGTLNCSSSSQHEEITLKFHTTNLKLCYRNMAIKIALCGHKNRYVDHSLLNRGPRNKHSYNHLSFGQINKNTQNGEKSSSLRVVDGISVVDLYET